MPDDEEAAELQYQRLHAEQRTRVTRDWSIPSWAGTSDKLVTVQRLAEDCLERAWRAEVESIKANTRPEDHEMWIRESVDQYKLKVEVTASGGRITKTGELSTIFADTDLRDVEAYGALENERKSLQVRTEELQARRNSLSKQIGQLKGKGEDTAPVMAEVAGIGDELKRSAERLEALQGELSTMLMGIPNLPDDAVPAGAASRCRAPLRS